jgi:hypothetical protein
MVWECIDTYLTDRTSRLAVRLVCRQWRETFYAITSVTLHKPDLVAAIPRFWPRFSLLSTLILSPTLASCWSPVPAPRALYLPKSKPSGASVLAPAASLHQMLRTALLGTDTVTGVTVHNRASLLALVPLCPRLTSLTVNGLGVEPTQWRYSHKDVETCRKHLTGLTQLTFEGYSMPDFISLAHLPCLRSLTLRITHDLHVPFAPPYSLLARLRAYPHGQLLHTEMTVNGLEPKVPAFIFSRWRYPHLSRIIRTREEG